MNINLSKTINELAPIQIADLIDVEYETVKAVAAASNGSFLTDRATMPASEFLTKYFAEYAVYDTLEKMEERAIAKRAASIKVTAKAKAKVKAKAHATELLEEYGNYIVAIWECAGEFAASYRKTDHMDAHFHLLSKHEIEYKPDGRRFSVVYHTQSRIDALEKKTQLIEDYINRGLLYKGDLPV